MANGVLFYRGIFGLIIATFNIIFNTLTIIAFFQVKILSLNPSNLLILALSFADLLYGTVVLILDSIPYAFLSYYPYGEYGCMLLVSCSNFYVIGNLLLVAISVDRLLLVLLNYSTYVKFQTKLRIKIAIAACCAMGAASAAFEMGLWNYAKKTNPVAAKFNFGLSCFSPARFTQWFGLFYSIGLYFCPVILIIVLSGVFFCLLRVRIKKANQIGSSVGSRAASNGAQISTVSTNAVTIDPPREKSEGTEVRSRYIKAAVTLGALVSAMGICILPYCTHIIVGIFCPECTSRTSLYVVLTIVQINPLLDPIFYSATQRNIRDYYRNKCDKFLKWCRGR